MHSSFESVHLMIDFQLDYVGLRARLLSEKYELDHRQGFQFIWKNLLDSIYNSLKQIFRFRD